MLFSILVANYNNSKYLPIALESVMGQTYSNWEVILVDDGSTDGFESIIQPYISNNRIRVFRNTANKGCGYTKRKCARLATGDILAFLDPDDALHPDALQVMVDAHKERPAHSIINSTHYVCDKDLNILRVSDVPGPLIPGIPYLLVSDGRVHAFATFKKSLYDQTEGISIKNKKAVDQDLYYKMEETGPVWFIDQALYYYRIHPGAISNSGQERKAMIANYHIVEEACNRRIKALRSTNDPDAAKWVKKYRTWRYKVRIFRSVRERKYLLFISNLVLFPFVGGFNNIISYCRKIPKEGLRLLRRSFIDSYEIKS
jgi:glycosyltransferase involved in cell wall biosynthesis